MKHSATRQLLILRHGKARKDLPVRDRERPLAEEGREDIRRVATAALKAGLLPDLVLCSPAVRTRETAEAFLAATRAQADVSFIEEIYDGSADDLLQLIVAVPVQVLRLMLVGHNPDLENLARRLCGERKAGVGLQPGVLVAFEITGAWRELSAKTAIFKERIDPRA